MIISVAQAQLFFLALTRILAVLIHIPVLGSQNSPNQIRIGLGLVLTLVLIPWQPLPPDAQTMGLIAFSVAIGKELLIGTLSGFASALIFGAVEMAGEVMGMGSGFGSSRIFNPTINESGSAFNQLFVIIASMYFMVVDGHHAILIALERTFKVIPINGDLPINSLESLMKITAQLFITGVQLALPVMVALFLADLTLGLLARVAPQVQVFFLGLPLKVGVSLIGIGLLFSVIFPSLNSLYQSIGPNMLQLLEK